MNLRQTKRALRGRELALDPTGPIQAATEFQRKRITEAVTAARLYLEGDVETKAMAQTRACTRQRAEQLVRLGVKWMKDSGWLRPAPAGEAALNPKPSPSQP